MRIILFIFILVFFTALGIYGQACCSAGTPLLGSMDVAASAEDVWQLSMTYEYNYLNDVLSGSRKIEGRRRRVSQSALAAISYGISQRLGATVLLSFIRQQRRLNAPNSERSLEEVTTNGPGDAVLLIKYNLVPLNISGQHQLAIGAGVKAPLGRSDLKLNGFLLPADMQPGSGAWDGILWLYAFQGFLPSRYNIFASASYRFTGKNNRFQQAEGAFKGYRFGNEFVLTSGVSYRTLADFDFSLLLRYRNVGADDFGGGRVVNTGGNWLYLLPGINYNFGSSGLRISGQIPAWRRLQGVQLTTSYTLNAAWFFTIQ